MASTDVHSDDLPTADMELSENAYSDDYQMLYNVLDSNFLITGKVYRKVKQTLVSEEKHQHFIEILTREQFLKRSIKIKNTHGNPLNDEETSFKGRNNPKKKTQCDTDSPLDSPESPESPEPAEPEEEPEEEPHLIVNRMTLSLNTTKRYQSSLLLNMPLLHQLKSKCKYGLVYYPSSSVERQMLSLIHIAEEIHVNCDSYGSDTDSVISIIKLFLSFLYTIRKRGRDVGTVILNGAVSKKRLEECLKIVKKFYTPDEIEKHHGCWDTYYSKFKRDMCEKKAYEQFMRDTFGSTHLSEILKGHKIKDVSAKMNSNVFRNVKKAFLHNIEDVNDKEKVTAFQFKLDNVAQLCCTDDDDDDDGGSPPAAISMPLVSVISVRRLDESFEVKCEGKGQQSYRRISQLFLDSASWDDSLNVAVFKDLLCTNLKIDEPLILKLDTKYKHYELKNYTHGVKTLHRIKCLIIKVINSVVSVNTFELPASESIVSTRINKRVENKNESRKRKITL